MVLFAADSNKKLLVLPQLQERKRHFVSSATRTRAASDVHSRLSIILFGELSVGAQCLKALANMVNHHKSSFKAKERLDEEFPAKFLLVADMRVQIWLNDCNLAKTVTKLTTQLLISGLS